MFRSPCSRGRVEFSWTLCTNSVQGFELNKKFLSCCPCWWGVTMSLNCSQQRAYCSSPRCYMCMEGHGGLILVVENRGTWRKISPSVTLFTTNLTWTDTCSNPDLRGERPVTKRLSHGTASSSSVIWWRKHNQLPKRRVGKIYDDGRYPNNYYAYEISRLEILLLDLLFYRFDLNM
jgi:hypothetical protein